MAIPTDSSRICQFTFPCSSKAVTWRRHNTIVVGFSPSVTSIWMAVSPRLNCQSYCNSHVLGPATNNPHWSFSAIRCSSNWTLWRTRSRYSRRRGSGWTDNNRWVQDGESAEGPKRRRIGRPGTGTACSRSIGQGSEEWSLRSGWCTCSRRQWTRCARRSRSERRACRRARLEMRQNGFRRQGFRTFRTRSFRETTAKLGNRILESLQTWFGCEKLEGRGIYRILGFF